MEGKRAATIVALCMLMLLSGQQQVAAMSKFCACYTQCYKQCKERRAAWLCVPNCLTDYSPIKEKVVTPEKVATPTSVTDCSKICQIFCGTVATDTSGVAAGVDDCTKNQSWYAKHL